MEVYQPREDSFLLEKYVKQYATGLVLDIGTGTGIQALAAKKAKKVIAVDKSKAAINYCKKNIKNKKIVFKQSDLFSNVNQKFDTIIFNPPYLPTSKDDVISSEIDAAFDGGRYGSAVIKRFLNDAPYYLQNGGKIYLVVSSLTRIGSFLANFARKHGLSVQKSAERRFFFERIKVLTFVKR